MTLTPSTERLSVMLSLIAVIMATLPRYLAGDHNERLILITIAAAALAFVSFLHWRELDDSSRRRLPRLLGRFAVCALMGLIVMSGWQFLARGGVDTLIALSQGATLGLLIYVVSLWLSKSPSH